MSLRPSKPRVLIACERSGRVRDALRARGIDAVSCDLEPSDAPGPHIQGDALEALRAGPWAGLIAFPHCTDLAVSGARYFAEKRRDGRQQKAVAFFMALALADIPRRAVENPVGVMSTFFRKPDQIVQPWFFGHRESKKTCLWLFNLPALVPTKIVEREPGKPWDNTTASGQNKLPPSPDRAYLRSLTYQGIADAMAEQWGPLWRA